VLELEGYLSEHPLDSEWYDRLLILRRRDRRFVREELEGLLHAMLIQAKKPPPPPEDDDDEEEEDKEPQRFVPEAPKVLTQPENDAFLQRMNGQRKKREPPPPSTSSSTPLGTGSRGGSLRGTPRWKDYSAREGRGP